MPDLKANDYNDKMSLDSFNDDDDDKPHTEYILTTQLTIPNTIALLHHKEIFIGDTSATVDTTPHLDGVYDLQSVNNEAIIMGNQTVANIDGIGKLRVTVHNKQGVPQFKGILDHIALSPACAFNFFSVSQRMAQGWTLHGNKESMWLEKPGCTPIVFDIVIPTRRGRLFCTHFERKRPPKKALVAAGTSLRREGGSPFSGEEQN